MPTKSSSRYIRPRQGGSFADVHPDKALEWHPTKNGDLKPSEVTYATGRVVWWLGKCGHEWQQKVRLRHAGSGCQICGREQSVMSSKQPKSRTPIAITHPDLAKEWNHFRNGDLSPNDVTHGSNKKVWWVCEYGHSYESSVKNRSNGSGCPYCSGLLPIVGISDLATENHSLSLEWHPTKNGNLTPRDVTAGSNKKVWWQCSICGHEWESTVNNRNLGRNCPLCANRNNAEYRREISAENGNSLIERYPEIISEWHPINNGELTPYNISPSSHKKVWWLCPKGHEYRSSPNTRITNNHGCPVCCNQMILKGENDLATLYPDLASEWHPTKNEDLLPDAVPYGTEKVVWWLCPKGHEYEMMVKSRTKGNNCPYCSNHRVLAGFNDLATTRPDIAKQWDYEGNGDLSPKDVTAGSNKKVWWLCPKGHRYDMRVCNKSAGSTCPYCLNRRR